MEQEQNHRFTKVMYLFFDSLSEFSQKPLQTVKASSSRYCGQFPVASVMELEESEKTTCREGRSDGQEKEGGKGHAHRCLGLCTKCSNA